MEILSWEVSAVNENSAIPQVNRWRLQIVLSILGMLMAAALAAGSLIARAHIIRYTETFGESLQETLKTTNSGLELIIQSLDNVEGSFDELQSSLDTLETSVEGLSPFLMNLSQLIGTDLAEISSEGAVTLSSAAESSKLIDSTLQFLARIPLLRLDYVPEVPLHVTLEKLSTDVDSVSPLLEKITADLQVSAGDIEQLGRDVGALAVQTAEIKKSLADAGPILDNYLRILTEVQSSTRSLFAKLPAGINLGSIFVASFALWAFLTQVLHLLEGLEKLKSGKIR
ncbi:MAG TPA: hypothetical protein PLA26_04425 [Anaerolineaceae bacterium]|nr:hypothetical protein [Anaerolineaceae bacterium]HOT25379.1 hypothetical protein [Anaerolineaceae bacterium]HQL27760.1 hypothetical protein [Anaerolineaceae bacterium]